MNECKDCEYAHKRSHFSFKTYGNHYSAYECSFDSEREKYVRLDDTCENFKKREVKDNG